MKPTFVVMPVANEEKTIEKTLQGIINLNIIDISIVIVIDRYSTDRTREIIERMQREFPIHLLNYSKSTGVVSCYLFGLKYALENGAEYVIEMDAGGSHDPSMIPQFISALDRGYDCVFASRFIKGARIENHPFVRRILSRGGTILANLVLGTKMTDITSGFKAVKRNVLQAMALDDFLSIKISHFYQTEMHYYCSKLNICEIPIVYTGSESSLKLLTIIKCLKVLFVLKKRFPIEKEAIVRSKY